MLKKLYYTSEIMTATIIGSAIMLLFYIVENIMGNDVAVNALITKSIIVVVLYFIVYFIAFFFLVNPFFDFLKGKLSFQLTAIVILIIANLILFAGLYVDTSQTLLEVIIDNYRLFLATNLSIIFFSFKKSS
ncbi:hypothetical protein [Virgibacillus sp. L01]|uniref:hypothetical protein n=1 Tax=Virgibacillus sp. L01 TaxID=3457429 RepID=UPI003FD5AC3E